MDGKSPRANDGGNNNSKSPRSPRAPLPQERHPKGILKSSSNNLTAEGYGGGGPSSPNQPNQQHLRRNSKVSNNSSNSKPTSPATLNNQNPNMFPNYGSNNNNNNNNSTGIEVTTNKKNNNNNKSSYDPAQEQVSSLATEELSTPPSARNLNGNINISTSNNNRTGLQLRKTPDHNNNDNNNTISVSVPTEENIAQHHERRDSAGNDTTASTTTTTSSPSSLIPQKRAGLGAAAQQQLSSKKTPNSSLNFHNNNNQFPSSTTTTTTNTRSQLSTNTNVTPITPASGYTAYSHSNNQNDDSMTHNEDYYDPNNFYCPNTYEIDDDDRMIDERAEFLGMDVDDFRALLHIAASKAQRDQREAFAAQQLLDDDVDSSSTNMNDNYYDYPSNSQTRFASTAAFVGGGANASQRTLGNNSFNNIAGGGGGGSSSSSTSSLVHLDNNIPEEASVAYLNIASQKFGPSSGGTGGGVAVPSFQSQQNQQQPGSPNHTIRSSVDGRSSVASYQQQQQAFLATRKGGLKKKKNQRESVASFLRSVGEGLVGRRVMWADEADEDEYYGGDGDSEFENNGTSEYSYGGSTLDGVSTLGSSSVNGAGDPSTTAASGSSTSGISTANNSKGTAKRPLSAKANAFKNSNTYRGTGKSLVRVTTYELNGQMIMGVSRVGQWRGWLWIFAYFIYHILIEWSAAQVGTHDVNHGREVLFARTWGAVFALVIALGFVGLSKILKTYPKSRSRTAWSSSPNGVILMCGCGMLFSAFEAFFWGSLHSAFDNGALVVYPTMFLAPVVIILLRRPFFPQRYINPNAAAPQDRIRAASTGGGSGEGRVVYPTEIACCVVVFLGGIIMNASFPGTFLQNWVVPMSLQFGAMLCAAVGCVCLAVLAQRGLLRFSIIAITSCRAFGYFFLMYSDELGEYKATTAAFTESARVLWLSVLMGIDYILFLSATMRSNQHLDIMAVAVVQMTSWIEVPVISIILAPSRIVEEGIVREWALWLGAAVVIAGSIGLGVFATARQSFVMYDLWKNSHLFLKPKGIKGQQQNNNNNNNNSQQRLRAP